MRGAIVTEFGRPPELGDIAEPASNGMTGKVLAASITPVDHLVASGRFQGGSVSLPFVTGKEGVAEIIDGGGRLPRGTHVYFEFSPLKGGALAERVALTGDDFVVEVPPAIDVRQAAALGGSTAITAWMALDWRAQLRSGETVLILGATGLVGLAAVAIAKILGAGRVVAAGRNVAGLERCRAAGADAIVDVSREQHQVIAAFKEATGGGPEVVIDLVSGKFALWALVAARPGARIIQIGNASGEDLVLPASGLVIAKSLNILGYANFAAPAERRAQTYRDILANIALGKIAATVETRSLADIAHAWESTKSPAQVKFLVEP